MRITLPGIIVIALLTTACEGGDAGDGGAAATRGADTAQGPVPAGEVTATLSEWDIELSRDTLAAGEHTFRVVNRGSVAHRFEIEGVGQERATELLQGGAEATLTVDLAAGEYEVYCPVENRETGDHSAKGMQTRLIVR